MRSPLPLLLAMIACGGGATVTTVTPPNATVVARSELPAQAIAVDGSNVYWTTGGSIAAAHPTVFQCSKSGCIAPTVLETSTEPRQWIAVDDTSVDWIAGQGSEVARCTIGGCGLSPVATPYVDVWSIATATPGALWNAGSYVTDRTDVYWVDGRNILSCPIGRCHGGRLVARGVLTDTGTGPQIAVDAQSIYWHDLDGDIVRCPKAGCATPAVVASLPGVTVSAIASDGVSVYWVAAGALLRAPVDGSGPPSTLVSGNVVRLALGVDAVYFTAGTSVMRTAK